jgi:protein SCO1/2
MRFMGVAVLGLVLAMTGCRQSGSEAGIQVGQGNQKTYALRGKIVATDPGSGMMTVDAGAIPGYMDAMTMPYKLANANTITEMHPGDVITARVVVDEDASGPMSPKLDHVVIVAEARPDTKPTVNYHVPAPGDAVPDFHLLNQSGKEIHLAQFKGKVLLVTFIYTRCPVADFCPRMSENFAEIDKALATDKAVYARTHLLSVSFNPKYDTPTVLRSYGGAHTGRFTDEDFKHWDFAAPSVKELPEVEHYFDVGVTGDDPSTLTHSLSTILIGKDGKVMAWYPTKDWQPAELVARIKAAAE